VYISAVSAQLRLILGAHMLKRAFVFAGFWLSFLPCLAVGQGSNCASSNPNNLICLIPTATQTPPGGFNFFNAYFGTDLSRLPLATPASGFIFTFDKKLGVYAASNQSFGPIMTERAETIGKHKMFLAFTYERFYFQTIDGHDLHSLPLELTHGKGAAAIYSITSNRIDAKVDQFATYLTFGLFDRIDVSLAVPFQKISLGVSSQGTQYNASGNIVGGFQDFLSGTITGIGDVVLAAKGIAYRGEKVKLAMGSELRLPTGDKYNFLGTGTIGVKPYVALSRSGRVSPHVDLGYQWNGKTILFRNKAGVDQRLPTDVYLSAGADFGVTKRLTLIGDYLGQRFLAGPRVLSGTFTIPNTTQTFRVLTNRKGPYSENSLSLGGKFNVAGKLLVALNALVQLDDKGLRSRVVPFGEVSYSF
jgi:hypothetical protein